MIKTKKGLFIRPYENDDMPILKQWFYSCDYDDFFRDMFVLSNEQLKIYSYMKDGQAFIIWDLETPIGFIILYEMKAVPRNLKLSILIDKERQGNGHCRDAMLAMGEYVFNRLQYDKIIVEVLPSNVRLANMILKGGFKHEAMLERETRVEGELVDVDRYCIFREEYLKLDVPTKMPRPENELVFEYAGGIQ